ncbi:hypothetical protein FPOAC1_006224 [Fusarium poae]|uniref:hypothetical protein n=1 Tax=Fusarium poae TaxID=36050 RepID=UPI001CE7E268|nr:hypothetical protein FPOAC1_006224 [Fusarium poae]KAG8672924.1 hypothetical protein FPOAC1_006224 [Fusarium poae]
MALSNSVSLAGEFRQSLSKLLETGAYSDLTIICDTDRYAVHKSIVCTRSPIFAAKCDDESKGASTGKIDLSGHDPVAVKMMIRYLYLQDYTPPETPAAPEEKNDSMQKPELMSGSAKRRCMDRLSPSNFSSNANFDASPSSVDTPARYRGSDGQHGGRFGFQHESQNSPKSVSPVPTVPTLNPFAASRTPNFVLHVRVYALGEKYGIKDLKSLSLDKFKDEAQIHHHSESFLLAVEHFYTSAIKDDWGMRSVFVSVLQAKAYLLENERLQNVIRNTELGLDLIMKLTRVRRTELKREASSL